MEQGPHVTGTQEPNFVHIYGLYDYAIFFAHSAIHVCYHNFAQTWITDGDTKGGSGPVDGDYIQAGGEGQ